MKHAAIEPGASFKVQFPFVMVVGHTIGEDCPSFFPSWKPGVEPDNTGAHYHGDGFMVLTVVSVHKPGNYHQRVFYTRKWIDPSGKVFGKDTLKVTSQGNFRRLISGYKKRNNVEKEGEQGIFAAAYSLAGSLKITTAELLCALGLSEKSV